MKLTGKEAAYLGRVATRLSSNKPMSVMGGKTSSLNMLADMFGDYWDFNKGAPAIDESAEIEVMMNRRGLRAAERIVKESLHALEQKVLPGYKKRGDSERVKTTEDRIEFAEELLAKIEQEL
jgi:hypothetical protein